MLGEKIKKRLRRDLKGKTHRAVGPGVQGQHRRHARGAEPDPDRRPGARRARRSSAYDPVAGSRGFRKQDVAHRRRRRWRRSRARTRSPSSPSGASSAARTSPRSRRRLKTPAIFDGRNLYDPAELTRARLRVLPDREEAVVENASTPSQGRVLVVGDVMLDRYWFGDVSRISPEAPVPVVLIVRRGRAAGRRGQRGVELRGAGRAHAPAVRGRPRRAGRSPGAAAEEDGDRREPAPRPRPSRTTQKLRVVRAQAAAPAHRFRDARPRARCSPRSSRTSSAASRDCDVVILSDYGKGGLTHITDMIRARAQGGQARAGRSERRRLLALQGREHHHAEPRGAARGGRHLEERARPRAPRPGAARASSGLEALLLTRGEDGMTLFRNAKVMHVKAQSARGVRRDRRRRHGDRDARR